VLAPDDLAPLLADNQAADGRHLIVGDPDGDHRLWLLDPDPGQPLAAIVPLDDDLPIRIAGLLRLRRKLIGRSSGSVPKALDITRRQRRRLILLLRALDGHLADATYREIAEALHGIESVNRYPWKTSSIRGQTIRLVKDAIGLMKGGYRKLLRGS
jgi:hypothetical protein